MELSNILKSWRKKSGLKQVELAEKFKVTQQLISAYESGGAIPSLEIFLMYLELAGIKLPV